VRVDVGLFRGTMLNMLILLQVQSFWAELGSAPVHVDVGLLAGAMLNMLILLQVKKCWAELGSAPMCANMDRRLAEKGHGNVLSG